MRKYDSVNGLATSIPITHQRFGTCGNCRNTIAFYSLRKWHIAIAIVVALSGVVFAQSPTTPSPALSADMTAVEILKEAVVRHGGQTAVNRWACGAIDYTIFGGLFPTEAGNSRVLEHFKYPGHIRRLAIVRSPDSQGTRELLFVINNDTGWMATNGNEPLPIDPAGANRQLHAFANICNMPHLARHAQNATNEGVLDIDGDNVIQVRSPGENGTSVDLFIETKSGLLRKTLSHAVDPTSGRRSMIETRLSNYAEMEGGPVPMRFSVSVDGSMLMSVDIHSVDFDVKHPPKTFQLTGSQ